MVATGLVSRHRSEFGTLRAVRFCGLEAVAQAILGALESLQGALRRPACKPLHSSFETVCQQLASFLRKLHSCLPSSFPSYVSLASFLRKLPSCLPGSLSTYVACQRCQAASRAMSRLPTSSGTFPAACPAASRAMFRLPASLGSFLAAAQQLPRPMPRRRRNKARAQRANSFRAQRLALKQLASPSLRLQTASERNASPSNSFRALRLALKQLPSATPRLQTASQPFAAPSNSFRAPRRALKQLRSAARPFCKDFRAPPIRSPCGLQPLESNSLQSTEF